MKWLNEGGWFGGEEPWWVSYFRRVTKYKGWGVGVMHENRNSRFQYTFNNSKIYTPVWAAI